MPELTKLEAGLNSKYLLTAEQMARFVTDGFILLDSFIPAELNQAVLADQKAWKAFPGDFWFGSESVRGVFDLPQVRGLIEGLVGSNPEYDHSYLHTIASHSPKAQAWHCDAIVDDRPFAFDIQLFYFPHDTPQEMGATLVLPGSHLRKVNNGSIGRYKNIAGQYRLAGKAGTLAVMHHAVWHCGQPNYTDQTRYMFKLRLRPTQKQHTLFNQEGVDGPEVQKILHSSYRAWQGNEDRIDHLLRYRLWRYVCGDENPDTCFGPLWEAFTKTTNPSSGKELTTSTQL